MTSNLTTQLQQPEDADESFMDTSTGTVRRPTMCCPSRQETISATFRRRAHGHHPISTQYIHLNQKYRQSSSHRKLEEPFANAPPQGGSWKVRRRTTSPEQSRKMSTPISVDASRRDLLKAALDSSRSAGRIAACIGRIETAVAGETAKKRQQPKRRLWLAPNQSENCFLRPAGRKAGQLNFLLFRFACSPSVYWSLPTPARAFSAHFRDDEGGRLHATATKQSTSDAYESGVYGGNNAEEKCRKNGDGYEFIVRWLRPKIAAGYYADEGRPKMKNKL